MLALRSLIAGFLLPAKGPNAVITIHNVSAFLAGAFHFTGRAMARLRETDPDVIALVSSEYANDPVLANCKEYGFNWFLAKPFTMKELGQALNKALSGLKIEN